jgi:lipopolysaccharide transport system permease protein
MVGVIEGFRWSLLGKGDGLGSPLIASVAVTLLLLVAGLFYFRSKEGTIADVL